MTLRRESSDINHTSMPTTSVKMVRTHVVAAASAIPIAKSKDRKGTVKLGPKKRVFPLLKGEIKKRCILEPNQEALRLLRQMRAASIGGTHKC